MSTFVTTPEDAILSKLEWQSPSASDTQRRDVVEMLISNFEALDLPYMKQWAAESGVRALLDELWASAADQRLQPGGGGAAE